MLKNTCLKKLIVPLINADLEENENTAHMSRVFLSGSGENAQCFVMISTETLFPLIFLLMLANIRFSPGIEGNWGCVQIDQSHDDG